MNIKLLRFPMIAKIQGMFCLYILIALLIALLIGNGTADRAIAVDAPFSVKVVQGSDQIPPFGYYHFKVSPGQKIELKALVKNQTSEAIQITMTPLNAYTSLHGIIYQPPQSLPEWSGISLDQRGMISASFSDFDSIDLAPHEDRVVRFQITAPANLHGTVLGAMRWASKLQDLGTTNDQSNEVMQFQIGRTFAVDLAVHLDHRTESIEPHSPFVQSASMARNQNVLELRMSHPIARIGDEQICQLEMRTLQQQRILKTEFAIPRAAPYSFFTIPIPLGASNLASGAYDLIISCPASVRQIVSVYIPDTRYDWLIRTLQANGVPNAFIEAVPMPIWFIFFFVYMLYRLNLWIRGRSNQDRDKNE
jgi:hypothetical protein